MKIPPPLAQGQVTPAVAAMFNKVTKTRRPTTKRRKKTATKPRVRKAAAKRTRGKPARLVKGSAAAKRHMAKLRRMRKK